MAINKQTQLILQDAFVSQEPTQREVSTERFEGTITKLGIGFDRGEGNPALFANLTTFEDASEELLALKKGDRLTANVVYNKPKLYVAKNKTNEKAATYEELLNSGTLVDILAQAIADGLIGIDNGFVLEELTSVKKVQRKSQPAPAGEAVEKAAVSNLKAVAGRRR